MDLETPQHISELNSAIAFSRLKNGIALFSSEMCWGVSKSTSHPRTMMCVCGTWHQYGNHNGGWAAVDFQDPAHTNDTIMGVIMQQLPAVSFACTARQNKISSVIGMAG